MKISAIASFKQTNTIFTTALFTGRRMWLSIWNVGRNVKASICVK